MTVKIVVFETEQWECDILQRMCCDHEIIFTEEPLRREWLVPDLLENGSRGLRKALA
ncbi:hypothetical protein [Marinobacter antarcticus]|uniref:hypothetical protein n=1 Tax=Marinobacter antarcticus TaxID=564117 RepID=UPI0026F274FF|nr:hypothetical protein [Marinobacter antarcticus]